MQSKYWPNATTFYHRHLLAAMICGLLMASGPAPRGAADELDDEWSFRAAERIPGLAIPREEEIIYTDGSRQWFVECDEFDAPAITGFHRQLWAFFRQGLLRNTNNRGEAFLRVVTDVDYCTPVDYSSSPLAAFDTSWSAWVNLTYVFYLKRTQRFGIELDGGKAEVINGVSTSALRRRVDANIDWDAEARVLRVTVNDFDDPRDMGVQAVSAPYYVIGRSIESTINRAYSINSGITLPLPVPEDEDGQPGDKTPATKVSVSASTYVQESKKRLKVTVEGASYYAEFGHFTATEHWNSDGRRRMEFAFGANWTSDADIEYDEEASWGHVECASQKKHGFDFSFKDFLTSVGLDKSGMTTCIASSMQLPVRVAWTAKPTLDHDDDELEGLFTKARFLTVWDRVNGGECWYQPRFSSTMTWRLHAYPTERSGAVIDVTHGRTTPHETKRLYVRRW
ncbi:MAG: hypothetical protein J5I93_05250 [Pirellulaceae bacterium]|nr:hypothetical protein [Pirellulaceae bacterium]